MRSNTTYDTKQNMRNKAEVSFSICTLSNPYEMGTSWQFKCVFWLPTTENRRRVSSKYATDITWCRLWSYHQLPDANCRRKNRASCETQILHTYAPRDDWDLFVLFVAVWRAGDVKINRFWEHFYLAFFRHMAWLISQISLLGWLCCALSCVLSCHQIFPSRNFTLSPDRSSLLYSRPQYTHKCKMQWTGNFLFVQMFTLVSDTLDHHCNWKQQNSSKLTQPDRTQVTKPNSSNQTKLKSFNQTHAIHATCGIVPTSQTSLSSSNLYLNLHLHLHLYLYLYLRPIRDLSAGDWFLRHSHFYTTYSLC